MVAMQNQIQIEYLPNAKQPTQINLCGTLNFDTVATVYEQVVPFIQRKLIDKIHLEGIHSSNSAGVALLLSLRKVAKQVGKPVAFVEVPQTLHQIAAVTGVADFLFI